MLDEESAGDMRACISTLLRLLRLDPGPLSSVRIVLRLASLCKGAGAVIMGSAVTALVAFVGRLWRLEPNDFWPDMRLMLVALDDCGACAEVKTADDTSVVGLGCDEREVMVATVSPRCSEDMDGREE